MVPRLHSRVVLWALPWDTWLLPGAKVILQGPICFCAALDSRAGSSWGAEIKLSKPTSTFRDRLWSGNAALRWLGGTAGYLQSPLDPKPPVAPPFLTFYLPFWNLSFQNHSLADTILHSPLALCAPSSLYFYALLHSSDLGIFLKGKSDHFPGPELSVALLLEPEVLFPKWTSVVVLPRICLPSPHIKIHFFLMICHAGPFFPSHPHL